MPIVIRSRPNFGLDALRAFTLGRAQGNQRTEDIERQQDARSAQQLSQGILQAGQAFANRADREDEQEFRLQLAGERNQALIDMAQVQKLGITPLELGQFAEQNGISRPEAAQLLLRQREEAKSQQKRNEIFARMGLERGFTEEQGQQFETLQRESDAIMADESLSDEDKTFFLKDVTKRTNEIKERLVKITPKPPTIEEMFESGSAKQDGPNFFSLDRSGALKVSKGSANTPIQERVVTIGGREFIVQPDNKLELIKSDTSSTGLDLSDKNLANIEKSIREANSLKGGLPLDILQMENLLKEKVRSNQRIRSEFAPRRNPDADTPDSSQTPPPETGEKIQVDVNLPEALSNDLQFNAAAQALQKVDQTLVLLGVDPNDLKAWPNNAITQSVPAAEQVAFKINTFLGGGSGNQLTKEGKQLTAKELDSLVSKLERALDIIDEADRRARASR